MVGAFGMARCATHPPHEGAPELSSPQEAGSSADHAAGVTDERPPVWLDGVMAALYSFGLGEALPEEVLWSAAFQSNGDVQAAVDIALYM